MPIVWTKEAIASLTPKRGATKYSPQAYDANELIHDLATALDAQREALERGIAQKFATYEVVADVLAYYKHLKADSPLNSTDARRHGVMLEIVRGYLDDKRELVRRLVRHWIARGGTTFAVRALYEYATHKTSHPKKPDRMDFTVTGILHDEANAWTIFGGRPELVRAEIVPAILASSDADYAATVALVGELREKATTVVRCDLTSLVPTEHAWAKADARALLSKPKKRGVEQTVRNTAYLFAALEKCDEARELFENLSTNAFYLAPCVMDAVHVLEDDAIAPLALQMKAWRDEPPKANIGLSEAREVARALALFDDERAAKAFEPWIGDAKSLGPIAVNYMQRFPARAVALLGSKLLEKTKGAEPAQQLLARVARSDGDVVRAAAAHATKEIRAAIEALLSRAAPVSAAQSADASELPQILRDPPWRKKGTRPVLPILENLTMPKHEERIVWPDEKTRLAAMRIAWEDDNGLQEKASDVAKARAAILQLKAQGEQPVAFFRKPFINWRSIDEAPAIEFWNEPAWTRHASESSAFSEVACMLARFGEVAIDGAVASATLSGSELAFDALARCDSPRVAPAMLRAFGRGALRRTARRWTNAFPETAALGLLPIALGAPSRQKTDAANVLRNHVPRDAVAKAAARFGEDVSRAAEALVAFDPLWDCPKSAPKLSAFAEVSSVPAIRLKNGHALPDDAKRNLLEMLQFTPLDPPYPGLAPVVDALDATSLDEAIRSLIDAWVSAGASSASAWPLRAIAHAGSDAMARELAAKIRKWPREKGRARALIGVDVLGAMGTDVALMHLFDLSKSAKNRHIEERAKIVLAGTAAARGLSGDALEDRLVPTLDLTREGTTTLDFGSRTFTVRIDDHFAPEVFDGATRLPSLPRAKKEDDAALAKAAASKYKTLKSDLDTLAKTLVFRFEHAMATGRTWDARDHRTLLVKHPLAGRVARKLIWAENKGGAIVSTFRVSEDGSLADDRDNAVTLDEESRVSVVHPLSIDAAGLAKWGTLLADYGIIQPFQQIGRSTFSVDASARSKNSIDMFAEHEIPYGVLFGRLESRGWRRGAPDDGSIDSLEKDFGGVFASLSFSPSIMMREAPPEKMTIDSVTFGGTLLGALPQIVFSEVMFDLHVFTPRR